MLLRNEVRPAWCSDPFLLYTHVCIGYFAFLFFVSICIRNSTIVVCIFPTQALGALGQNKKLWEKSERNERISVPRTESRPK